MMDDIIKLNRMLLIGSTGPNVGKTELACDIIKRFTKDKKITAIKVTTIKQKNGQCPRGGQGCGVCTSLEGDFDITQETDPASGKDTSRLLAAGAEKVFWLRVMKTSLKQALAVLLDVVGPDSVLVCESNSLRHVVEPGLFIMVKKSDEKAVKDSAKQVIKLADEIIAPDCHGFGIDLDKIKLVDGKWRIISDATAIIMVGGQSRRMGVDKSLLTLNNKPMVEAIYEQLHGSFSQILISSNEKEKLAFLGLKVVPDKQIGQGPLMGIASALEASANELNFVIACDIPYVDLRCVREMLKEAGGVDIVVPTLGQGRYEPLFAVYRKSSLKAINEVLSVGQRKISDIFQHCKVKYIDLDLPQNFVNINTMAEYHEYRKRYGN
ncbi:MAG: molybdenum cofactor guanylyltransferase [Planctomycetota bacterium]|jgi:molybdopterin-guanine dinucleotide biosynthesis protein A